MNGSPQKSFPLIGPNFLQFIKRGEASYLNVSRVSRAFGLVVIALGKSELLSDQLPSVCVDRAIRIAAIRFSHITSLRNYADISTPLLHLEKSAPRNLNRQGKKGRVKYHNDINGANKV